MQTILNSTFKPLTYDEWTAALNKAEATISLFNHLVGTGLAKIELTFIERIVEAHSDLSHLKTHYPEYLI